MEIQRRLEEKARIVQKAKEETAREEWTLEQINKDLQQYGCNSFEQATDLLRKNTEEQGRLLDEIKTGIEQLEKEIDWNLYV